MLFLDQILLVACIAILIVSLLPPSLIKLAQKENTLSYAFLLIIVHVIQMLAYKQIIFSIKYFIIKLLKYILLIIVRILINLTIIIFLLCIIRWLTPTLGSEKVYFLEEDRFYLKQQLHYGDDERLNKKRVDWAEEILKNVDLNRFKVKGYSI
jgi:hypothetical protein